MTQKIDYQKWFKLINAISLIIVIAIFLIEAFNNWVLYVSGSQGYGPDTIVAKLLRYLVLTSAINFTLYFICVFVTRNEKIDNRIKAYLQLLCVDLMMGNVAISHYQFACTLCLFALPVMLSVLFENRKLNAVITGLAELLQIIAIICRSLDPVYGVDMIPEAAIAIAFMVFLWIICTKCITHLIETRKKLDEAIIAEEERRYTEKLKEKNEELEQLSRSVIEALAKAVDFNEPYTAGHSQRVAGYAEEIARRLGLSEETCQSIYFAGLLHDVGKLGIDNSIINKEGKLTEEEFAKVKMHPVMGYEILKDIVLREEYAQGAKFHHERLDGKGYPDGSTEIPLVGRIIAVADAYDAMTSKRSYRETMPQSKVREQIEGGKGTQFDGRIADIMLQMIDEDTGYRMRQM